MKKQNATKRSLFAELMEGMDAMKAHREGKVTLRTHTVAAPKIKMSPGAEFFVAAREKFNVSRTVWAIMLRVSPRTVEKWEQGGQVSPIAATLWNSSLNTRIPSNACRRFPGACRVFRFAEGPSEQGRVLAPAPPQLAAAPISNRRKADARGLFMRNQSDRANAKNAQLMRIA
jgi:putative transcriptional regulator